MKLEIQLCVYEQIISVCNSERIIKIGQYLRKLCSNEKVSSFFDSQCRLDPATNWHKYTARTNVLLQRIRGRNDKLHARSASSIQRVEKHHWRTIHTQSSNQKVLRIWEEHVTSTSKRPLTGYREQGYGAPWDFLVSKKRVQLSESVDQDTVSAVRVDGCLAEWFTTFHKI